MIQEFKKYWTTHTFVAADLKTRLYWVYKRDLVPQKFPTKPVKDWHRYYLDTLKIGLTKTYLKMLEKADYYLDIGDGKGIPTGVGPKPVSDRENEPRQGAQADITQPGDDMQ